MDKEKYSARFTELMQRAEKLCVGKSHSASEWDELMTEMDENTITEERIMKEYNAGLKAGRSQATSAAVSALMGGATAAFQAGLDNKAIELRQHAKELAEKLKQAF